MTGNGSIDLNEFIRNLHLFTHLARHNLEGRFVNEISENSLSFVQMNLMRVLVDNPGQTVGDIAKFMNVSYPAATKTIDKLVRLGYLRRQEDARDRRIAHLYLTDNGNTLVDRYFNLRKDLVSKVINHYGDEESRVLNEQLLKFAQSVVEVLPINSGVCMQCGAFDPEYCLPVQDDKSCGMIDALK